MTMAPDLIYLSAKESEELSEAGLDTVLYSDCNYDWSERSSKVFQFVKTILLYLLPFILMFCAHFKIMQTLRMATTTVHNKLNSMGRVDEEQLEMGARQAARLRVSAPGTSGGHLASKHSASELHLLTGASAGLSGGHCGRAAAVAAAGGADQQVAKSAPGYSSCETPLGADETDEAALGSPGERLDSCGLNFEAKSSARAPFETQDSASTIQTSVSVSSNQAKRAAAAQTGADAQPACGGKTLARLSLDHGSDRPAASAKTANKAIQATANSGPQARGEREAGQSGQPYLSPASGATGLRANANGRRASFSCTNQLMVTIHSKHQLESRQMAAKMLMAIVALFGICYLPVHLINFLR